MLGYLMDGGWMMLPLLVCSIAMAAVIIDRIRAFRCAAKVDPAQLRSQVCASVADGDLDKAFEICRNSEGPVAAVLLTGLERLKTMREKGRAEIEIGEIGRAHV